jgi:3-oxoacyl-[acyl-carrier protein] reductase
MASCQPPSLAHMRTALVTGVSRRIGIGFTLARRLAADGMTVLATGWTPHDAEQPWGVDELDERGLAAALNHDQPPDARPIAYRQDDLADPDVPGELVDTAVRLLGSLDVLVATHARSSDRWLAQATAAELDLCWAVNVRATLLLVQRMAAHHTGNGGRVVLFTSGQHLGAMPGELPYVVTKGALQQVTATLARELAPGITVNCVNPGPVDTGYADQDSREWVAGRMPMGRWGRPQDTAELVSWLAGGASGWVTGQTLVSDGGWSVRG